MTNTVNLLSAKLAYAQRRLATWNQVIRLCKMAIAVGLCLIMATPLINPAISLGIGIPVAAASSLLLAGVHLVAIDRRPHLPGYDMLRDEDPDLPDRRMTALDYWSWRVDYLGAKLSEAVAR